MSVIVTKPTSLGVFNQVEKLALELEMEFKATKLYCYKEFTYIDGQLTGVNVYEDNTKIVQLFNKTLAYIGSRLTQTILTRTSDSATLTKDFVYDVDSNLESVTVS